jgi:hypothetical protein
VGHVDAHRLFRDAEPVADVILSMCRHQLARAS